jgi:hypothetical protein
MSENYEGLIDRLIIESECSCECKGVFFRYSRSVWMDEKGCFHNKESFRLLKRESCNGFCGQNSGTTRCLASMFEDDVRMVGMEQLFDEMEMPHNLTNGCKLMLGYEAGTPDYETGICDDFNYTLTIVK